MSLYQKRRFNAFRFAPVQATLFYLTQACAAYGQRDRWSSRKPSVSSDSDHSAEHKALSGSAAVDWKRTLDNWDRCEPELSSLCISCLTSHTDDCVGDGRAHQTSTSAFTWSPEDDTCDLDT